MCDESTKIFSELNGWDKVIYMNSTGVNPCAIKFSRKWYSYNYVYAELDAERRFFRFIHGANEREEF